MTVTSAAPAPLRAARAWALPEVRLRHVWVALTVVATVFGPASTPLGLDDVWFALPSGAWMLSHHALTPSALFTSAPELDGPWRNAQWGAYVTYALLDQLGGLALVIAGNAAVIAVAFALLLATVVTASGSLRLSCGLVVLAYGLSFSNLTVRPQTLAYPFFALFLLVIARAARHGPRREIWLLCPAMGVWANVHGSFVLGLLLLGCAAVGAQLERRSVAQARPYWLVLGGCLLCACLTPTGPGSLAYLASIGSSAVIRNQVTEWAATTVDRPEGLAFYGSLGVVVLLAMRSQVRLAATEWLTLIVFGGLAAYALRSVVWWAFVVAPVAARLMAAMLPRPHGDSIGRERPWLNAALLAAIALLTVSSLPWLKAANPLLPPEKRVLVSADVPQGAAAFVAAHPPAGTLFTHQPWGGYLEWALRPGVKPFLDGRFEQHPAQVWEDYLRIVYPAANWRDLLDTYQVSTLLLSRRDNSYFVEAVRADPAWRLDYEDEVAVVFTRSSASALSPRPSS